MECKNFKELQKAIQSKIDKALLENVFPEVKKEELESIQKNVYDVYKPSVYERRGNHGGLGDPSNIVCTVKNGRLEVIKESKPNPYARDGATTNKNFMELIEYGHGYNGNYYDYPGGIYDKPRRPIEMTKIKIDAYKDKYIDLLKYGLKAQGIETK